MNKKKTTKIISIVAVVILVIAAGIFVKIKIFEKADPADRILQISLPKDAKVIKWQDDHGGLNGDGSTYGEIELSEKDSEEFIKKIKESGNWSEMPFNSTFKSLVCKSRYSDPDKDKIPNDITNGYYYLRDRYAESYPTKKDINIMGRSSFNFDAAVFDLDKNKVYIYVLDT